MPVHDAPPGGLPAPATGWGRVALIAGAILFFPATACFFAGRGSWRFAVDLRLEGWRAVDARRLLWALLIASTIVIGSLPQTQGYGLASAAAGFVLLATIGGLGYLAWQHRGQERWRETGGRMTPTEPARGRHRSPSVSDRLGEVEDRFDGVEGRFDELASAVGALRTGLVRAFQAGGEAPPAELAAGDLDETRPILRLVGPDERKTGS